MRYRVGVYAGLLAALFFCSTPAHAAEFEITTLGECREYSEDLTIVKRTTIPPHKQCGKETHGRVDAIEDLWLGHRWWIKPTSKETFEPAAHNVASGDEFSACHFIPPDAKFVILWFERKRESITPCKERGAWYWMIRGGIVCLLPGEGRCVKLEELQTLARTRVDNSIDKARRVVEERRQLREARLGQ